MSSEKEDLSEDGYAEEFLKSIHDRKSCDWCKNPHESIYRSALCRHCYRINREIAKLEAKSAQYKKQGRELTFEDEINLKLARAMAEDAQREGSRYGNMHSKSVDGLDLEHEFSYLSRSLLGKDLFHGDANLLDYSLTPSQKAFVFYMLSQISRGYRRRNRRKAAFSHLHEA